MKKIKQMTKKLKVSIFVIFTKLILIYKKKKKKKSNE